MPEIDLSLIRPNPFRDFSLHPIDPVQVDRLKASIGADGFWASVVARKVGDNYQIAFGHHRIEAAKLRELSTVPIEVRALTDWQMARMLASENATQRGSSIAALPGSEPEHAPGGILIAAGVPLSCWCLEHWTALLDRNLPKSPRGGVYL